MVKGQEARGSYGGVFEYKYLVRNISEHGDRLHCWGMLLWDKIMIFVAHHHPKAPSQQGAGGLTSNGAGARVAERS